MTESDDQPTATDEPTAHIPVQADAPSTESVPDIAPAAEEAADPAPAGAKAEDVEAEDVALPPVDSPKHAAPPAARTNRALAVTFGILAGLFLAGTGAMTALYVNQTDAYAKEARLASQRAEQVAAAEAQLVQAKTQLQTANTANTNLQAQLSAAQTQLIQTQSEKAAVTKCLDDLHKFFIATDANASDATLTSLYNTAQVSCDQANQYLSP